MGNEQENERGRLTPEQALKMLKEENVELTLDQAKLVLEFLRKLANLTVSNYLNQNNEKDSRSICESKHRRTSRQRILTKKSRGSAKKVLSN
jgi:hypothetical protein